MAINSIIAAKEKLEIVLSAPVPAYRSDRRDGRNGGVARFAGASARRGGIPPAEPREFRSDIIKYTPHLCYGRIIHLCYTYLISR